MESADREKHTIGLAGVGLMGLGIATNLVAKGWRLVFLDHPGNQKVNGLLGAGAQKAESGAGLAAQCDVILLCVTGSPQVEDILSRKDGILAGMKPDTVIIDCSTAIPSSTRRLAQLVAQKGGAFIDAPMTRTPKEAMEGRLNLICGGEEAVFAAMVPLLESFAENVTHVGGIGAGHTMKLLHNYVSLGFTAVLAEASASAQRAGIAPERFVEVLAKGGGNSVVLDRLSPYLVDGDVSGLKFSVANAGKDIGYYVQMADDLGAQKQAAEAILKLLEGEIEAGHGERMLPELVRLLNKP